MKTKLFVKVITIIYIFLIILFGPLLQINESFYSLINIMNKWTFAYILLSNCILLLVTNVLFLVIEKFSKITTILYFVCCIIFFLGCFYAKEQFSNCSIWLLFIYGVIALIVFLHSLKKSLANFTFNTKDIVEMGIFIALAIVLDLAFFKFKIVPNGGSISLVMLPLLIYSYRNGFVKGLISAGLIFGLINCLMDGYGIFTFPFDYFLGFGSVAVIGLFKNKILNKKGLSRYLIVALTAIIVMFIRVAGSTISGMLFYNVKFVPSLIYQLSYVPISTVICYFVFCLLLKPISKFKN